jgi:hypothetical protein
MKNTAFRELAYFYLGSIGSRASEKEANEMMPPLTHFLMQVSDSVCVEGRYHRFTVFLF